MTIIRRIALLVGGLVMSGCFCVLGATKYNVEIWQADRGLPQSTVTSIAQTSDGYLWVGTQNGLARFDGVRFQVFDEHNTPAIHNSRIVHVFESRDHSLWIGTEQGWVVRYYNGKFTDYKLPSKGTTHDYIRTFAEDEHGTIWALNCEWELSKFSGDRFMLVDLAGKTARSLANDNAGNILVGTESGLLERHDDTFEALTNLAGENGSLVEFLARSRDGGWWVAWNGRLRKLESGHWTQDLGPYPWAGWPIYDLYEDRGHQLWVATMGGGLYCYKPDGTFEHFSIKDGLPTDFIRCVTQDSEGNIWLGTESGGLCRLKPALFQAYNPGGKLASDQVMSICRRDDHFWIGFNGDGLDCVTGDQVRHFGSDQGLNNGHAWSVLEDSHGTTWVGTWDGLFRYDGERFVNQSEGATIGWQVLALYEDSKGDLWVGQQAFGALTRLHGNEREVIKIPGTSASLDVRVMMEDHDGNFWAGSNDQGLFRRDRNGQWTNYGRKDGLGSESIWSLYVDNDGVLWIGTCRGGLSRYSDGKFTTWTTKEGLINNVICQILEDNHNNLWLGSYGGVFRVNKKQLNQDSRSIQCVGYTQHDGLPSVECQGGFQPSGWKSRDGRLWFSTIKGLAVVNPDIVMANPLPPPVMVEDVFVDGVLMKPDHALSHIGNTNVTVAIPPGKQGIDFNYTAICLTAPEEVRFKYQLEGLESDWVEAGSRRTVRYSHVPPGNYQFRVIACNNDGVWNKTGASLAVVVLPHFWQTTWFFFAVALFSLTLAAGITNQVAHKRMQQRLELAERQRAVEQERARIAQDMHDDLGAHLTEIALLSEFAQSPESTPETVRDDVEKIMTKARALTASLDEIVWAVEPENDSLESFVTYACSFAEKYLRTMRIACRLELPDQLPHVVLMTEVRHNLFLAFKEALNNAVKHAQATEVQIGIAHREGVFTVTIRDNGKGFVMGAEPTVNQPDDLSVQPSGLVNIRKRLEAIHGKCEVRTRPGAGTEVKLVIALTLK